MLHSGGKRGVLNFPKLGDLKSCFVKKGGLKSCPCQNGVLNPVFAKIGGLIFSLYPNRGSLWAGWQEVGGL